MKTATQIVIRALTLLDEQLPSFSQAATTEMSLKDMALDILPTVARNLVKELPYLLKRHLAVSAVLSPETLTSGESQSGYTKQKVAFSLPADFWELVAIRLTVWTLAVTEYITIDSAEYAKQHNPFTRGGKQNPVVAINNKAIGSSNRIECFSIEDGDSNTVATFQYVSFNNVPIDSLTAVKQKETIVLTGGDGEATITGAGGLEKTLTMSPSTIMSELAEVFVTDWAADYLAEDIVITAVGDTIVFEALVAGTPFVAPVITIVSGNIGADVDHTTANVVGATEVLWPDELFDHITKALAMELNIIKDRLEQSAIREKGAENIIAQHK